MQRNVIEMTNKSLNWCGKDRTAIVFTEALCDFSFEGKKIINYF